MESMWKLNPANKKNSGEGKGGKKRRVMETEVKREQASGCCCHLQPIRCGKISHLEIGEHQC